jgi:uncharacterized protein YndB with AHSA1/START domain
LTADREVRIIRTFDAPRELVFRAWLDPDQLAAWWPPEGVELPRSSISVDARPGGHFEFTYVDASLGQEYPLRMEIVEIVEPELLLFESPPAPEMGIPELTTRVVFEEDGDRTTVTVTQGPHTDEMAPNAKAGWISVLDKLEALLARAEGGTASP